MIPVDHDGGRMLLLVQRLKHGEDKHIPQWYG